MLYRESALEELEYAGEDERTKLVYAYFGLAVYEAQCLEGTFDYMILASKLYSNRDEQKEYLADLSDKHEREGKTMGKLLNELQRHYELPNDLTFNLRRVLERRNYLVHDYFKENAFKFCSEEGERKMIRYFCYFYDRVKQVDYKLDYYYQTYRIELGITEEKIAEIIEVLRKDEEKN